MASRSTQRSTPRRRQRRRELRLRARRPVERLRAICLALPETTEKMAWGEPTWRVRGRLFAQLDNHHHGADRLAVWLPAALGVQELLIKSDPKRFFVPPYVGPRGWIGMRTDRRPGDGVGRMIGNGKRTVFNSPKLRFTPEEQIKDMDAQGVDVPVGSIHTPFFGYQLDASQGRAHAREVNDEIAGMTRQWPT